MRLQDNPFYLLNVSIVADKETILAAAKEMAFSVDADKCEVAQKILLSPSLRLSAEMGWFPSFDPQCNILICRSIQKSLPISIDWISPLAKLNAIIYNFSISPAMHESEKSHLNYIDENIVPDILNINHQFSRLNSDDIEKTINQYRSVANFPGVSHADVLSEINNIRNYIRQTIKSKLAQLDLAAYLVINVIKFQIVEIEFTIG